MKEKKTIKVSKEDYNRMVQDLRDMHNATQTIFRRCQCGRMAERGIRCPTNLEGGNCEAGS